jgi:hypothetical protein
MPLSVLSTSSMELALAAAPVVLIPKDCETAVWCKVIAIDTAITKRKSLAIISR